MDFASIILSVVEAICSAFFLPLVEDSLAGNIKAAPVVMVDAAASPTLDKQVTADLAAFEASNK